ncbi:MAG: T9SS type A sorting domain-containing protein [Ignavibacteria bacterium]
MKTLTLILIFIISFFNGIDTVYSQTGSVSIYNSGNLGIRNFKSFKIDNNPKRHLFIQLTCSTVPSPPNNTGIFLKINRANNSSFIPYNSFLNSHWVYEGFNGYWVCNPVGDIAIAPLDTAVIIKHSDEIVSDCCGYVQVNEISFWNIGITNSVEVPDYSTYCGMDIDSTPPFYPEANYYYAYKLKYSFNNVVNAIIKVTNYLNPTIQEVVDTIPSLMNFSDGGFLKINPFKRNYIFVTGEQLMLSTTSGTDFFSVNIPPVKKLLFSEADRKIYGYTSSSLYNSSNNGLSWDSVSLPYNFKSMEVNPDSANIIYAGNENGLYISRDKGISWNLYNNSFLLSRNVIGISKDNFSRDTIFVCTDKEVYKVWASFIVKVSNYYSEIPEEYSLSQNYPNPFNPITIIKYQCSMYNDVSLKVYGVLGNEVSTLVNEKQSAGSYSVTFNGSNFPSGVYFYKLQAGEFVETRRMVLIK